MGDGITGGHKPVNIDKSVDVGPLGELDNENEYVCADDEVVYDRMLF